MAAAAAGPEGKIEYFSKTISGTKKYFGTQEGVKPYNEIGFPLAESTWLTYKGTEIYQKADAYINDIVERTLALDPKSKRPSRDTAWNPKAYEDFERALAQTSQGFQIMTSNDKRPILLIAGFEALKGIMPDVDLATVETELKNGVIEETGTYREDAIARFNQKTQNLNKAYNQGVLESEVYPASLVNSSKFMKELNFADIKGEKDENVKALNNQLRKAFVTNGTVNESGNKFLDTFNQLVNQQKDKSKGESIGKIKAEEKRRKTKDLDAKDIKPTFISGILDNTSIYLLPQP